MHMHHDLFERLRVLTCLLQFYCKLTAGFFSADEVEPIDGPIRDNIDRLNLMKDTFKWDGKYDLVLKQIFASEEIVRKARTYLPYKQLCSDDKVADYIIKHPEFHDKGINLKDLKPLLDIEDMFFNGYMLHDVYHGYPKKGMYVFQIDCLDYLYSAAYFFNEGYDYYHGRKTIKDYSETDITTLPPYELRRIQSGEEVMFRNFRESYINLIFFVESFINSVGIDAYLNESGRNADEQNQLRGIERVKNGWKTYSTLKQRLKNISRIISGIEMDVSIEPIKSYLEFSVELRNQYVHSSSDKPKLDLSIDDWKSKCDEMIDHWCFDVLNAFWKSCYPNKVFPRVIFNEFYGNSFKGHQGRFMITK